MLGDFIRDLRVHYVQVTQEVQRQMQAQMQKGMGGPQRPGPGGAIPGPGFWEARLIFSPPEAHG